MTYQPSRRVFIRSAAAVAIVGVVSAPLVAAPATNLVGSRLTRAIALHGRIAAEQDRFDRDVEMPARTAIAKEIDALPVEAPPPHEQVATAFVNIDDNIIRLSTERHVGARAIARRLANDPTWADMGTEDWRQAHRELADACDRRDAIIAAQKERAQKQREAIRAKHNLAAIELRSDTLTNRALNLYDTIVLMPVVTIHQLAEKLSFIERHGDELNGWEAKAISADIKRLAVGAVA